MALPEFPHFVEVELAFINYVRNFFRNHPVEASEYTFTNIFAFREAYGFRLSVLNGNLIIKSEKDAISFFCPVGDTNVEGTLKDLFAFLEQYSDKPYVERVPHSFLEKYVNGAHDLHVEEDRNNFDYLYGVHELIELKGRKFHDKKNNVNQFRTKYSYEYLPLNAHLVEECLEFEDYWCEVKECGKYPGLQKERCAILEMLKNFEHLDVKGGVIRIEKKIAALTLGEKTLPDTFVIHIEKANPKIPGLYQVINQEFLMHEAKDCTYVNREQDLGFEGLRRAKMSYNPIKFIRKYKLKQNLQDKEI